MCQSNFKLLELNQNGAGIWITQYQIRKKQLYIPFEWLTIDQSNSGINLSWTHAIIFNRKKRPRLQARDTLFIRKGWVTANSAANFFNTVTYFQNGATGPVPVMKPVKSAKRPKARRKTNQQFLLILATALICNAGISLIATKQSPLIVSGNDFHKKANFKQGLVVKSRDIQFKINKAYAATSSNGHPLLILNMNAKPLKDSASLDASNFTLYKHWTAVEENNQANYSDAEHHIGESIQINGKVKPVVNVLGNDGWGSGSNEVPTNSFNVILKRPNQAKFDLVYEGFYYQFNKPDKYEDTSIVLHVKTKSLEVLK